MTALPASTYRLQFRSGMDFARARALVPYLAELGAGALYASPIFTATSGSAHGYDITDPTEIDPALGGREGLARLSAALRDAGLGLILDIVPNHMAFSVETPWLRDILRNGGSSIYARHFDTDLAAERLRLPWLGQPFEEALQGGELAIEDDPDGPVLVAGGLRVPLADTPALPEARETGSVDALRRLHAEQPWQLLHWRTETDAITHRRFFSVTGLIGTRVEDPRVFDDLHRLLFELVEDGTVTGIRVDHVDGLADPTSYLEKLRERAGDTPVWVEKILTGDERLPDWPIQGTTGYEVARDLNRLLTDPEGLEAIRDAYRERTDRDDRFAEVLARAKTQIVTHDLAAELWTLHQMLTEIAGRDPLGAELGPETLREGIIATIVAFPRYRTYPRPGGPNEADRSLIDWVADRAAETLQDDSALRFIARVLLGGDPATQAFRTRFQQVTGAAMAKSLEDTAFYREVRLLSLNEVGASPMTARSRSPSSTNGCRAEQRSCRWGSALPPRMIPSGARTPEPGSPRSPMRQRRFWTFTPPAPISPPTTCATTWSGTSRSRCSRSAAPRRSPPGFAITSPRPCGRPSATPSGPPLTRKSRRAPMPSSTRWSRATESSRRASDRCLRPRSG